MVLMKMVGFNMSDMKLLKNISLLLVSFPLLLCSCSKEAPRELPLEVSYNTISGIWELTQWNGQELSEGSYLWMSIDRRDRKFVIYQKIDSMYGRKITGTYSLTADEVYGSIISGIYDYGAGNWANEYVVSDILPSGTMVWKVLDGESEDVSVYTKHEEIPSWVLEDCSF